MGRPYKIIELLKFFLDNYNLKFKDPHNPQGISCKIIGLRKGEKKDESLYSSSKACDIQFKKKHSEI